MNWYSNSTCNILLIKKCVCKFNFKKYIFQFPTILLTYINKLNQNKTKQIYLEFNFLKNELNPFLSIFKEKDIKNLYKNKCHKEITIN